MENAYPMKLVYDDMDLFHQLNDKLERMGHFEEDLPVGERTIARRVVSATITAGESLHGAFANPRQLFATDITSFGMGAISETPIEDGQTLILDLRPVLGEPMQVNATVVYCRKILSHSYRLGLQFEQQAAAA